MSDPMRGRNINIANEVPHSVVEVNSLTATTLALPRKKRITFSACLEPGFFDVNVIIRYYPAGTDDIKQGRDVLTRRLSGNDNLFNPIHIMLPDNIYDGEISAITDIGVVNLFITES